MNQFQRRALAARNSVGGIQLVGAQLAPRAAMINAPALAAQLAASGLHPIMAQQAAQAAAGATLQGQTPYGGQVTAYQTTPDRTNRFPFPMPSATVGAAAAGVSTANAQIPTKPVRLVMSESTGPSSLTDITIATTPQFANLAGNFPIAAFSATATDSLVGFDTAQTGQAITLSLFNAGGASTTVLSGFFCDVAL